MGDKTLNFDATKEEEVVDFVRLFFDMSAKIARPENEKDQRIYKQYRGEIDTAGKDPNRPNIHIPKMYSIIETIMPVYVDALFGVRPYIPVEFTNEGDDTAISDAQTDLIDTYLDSSNFFWEGVKAIKYVILFGTSFLECLPDFENRRIQTPVPRISTDFNGNPVIVGMDTKTEIKKFLKLVNRAYAPWEIYKDPLANSIDQCRGIVKFRGMTSKRQLKKMAERGAFPDFDLDKLDHQDAFNKDDWSQTIAKSIGVVLPSGDDDMGVWLSFESNDRYIDLWNFKFVLRDQPNPYAIKDGGHGKINLTRFINTDDPNPANSWYGIGEGRPIEKLCAAINKSWNQTFHNHDLQNEGVIYYDDDALAVDSLIMLPGNRIPVTPPVGGKIEDAIFERPTPGLPSDFYNIPTSLELQADKASGQPDIARGEAQAGGSKTAREAIIRKGAGDARMKLKIRMGEQMGLADFGIKVAHIIDQFATPDDIIDKIGIKRAAKVTTVNPAAREGGFRLAFKGSNRLADAQIKRQDAKDIYQLMAGNPSINQEMLANWLLEKFELPLDERRKMVRNDEEALQIAEQQALAGAAGSSSGSGTRSIASGRTLGSNLGNSPTGRDNNEKLSSSIV